MQPPKPKEVFALSGEIIRLETELTAARAKYNALFGISEPPRKQRTATLDEFTERVLMCVEVNCDEELSIGRAAALMNEQDIPVGKALYRLAKAGRIANPRRGRYQAKEKEADSEEKTS